MSAGTLDEIGAAWLDEACGFTRCKNAMDWEMTEIAATIETERRSREIQLLINVVEPDPEYQPFLITDEATITDAVGGDPEEIKRRLDFYFGRNLGISLHLPLWTFVDRVKDLMPGWPDEF